jgi:hypothetical protein
VKIPVSTFIGASAVTALVVVGPMVLLAKLLERTERKGRNL